MYDLNREDYIEIFGYIIKKNPWKKLVPYNFVINDETPENIVYNHISFCTTIMNRTDDLKETLPKNIEDNLDYPNLEFLILDYNSTGNEFDNLYRFLSQSRFIDMMKTGKLSYYRSTEPEYYSMAKSRNLAFKQAKGKIVVNVDADNFTNKGFATKINQLANHCPSKAVFVKGSRLLRGRLGLYKDEFIDLLGGYNEDLVGYGVDDRDLLNRALGLNFKAMCFGGKFFGATKSKQNKTENMLNKDWRYTQNINKVISFTNLLYNMYKANQNRQWGVGNLIQFKDIGKWRD